MMLSSLLILMGSCLSQSDASQQPDTAGEVAKLVRQLDDDQRARRQSAEAELIKLGPGVLELLPPAEARMSPELKERLARVRSQLQVEYARQVVEPSRVTLQGTISLAEALRTIQQATGNQIEGYEDLENERVTVDLPQVPFWEAFDRVLDQVKLAVDPYAGQSGTVRVEPRPDGQIDRFDSAYYEGPFRLEATHVTAVRDLRNAAVSGLRVRLSIAWEPKTKPISISVPLSEIVARDNLGRAVPTDHLRGRLTAAIESDLSMIEMELPLKLPPRDAEFIASLQGTFDVMIPGRKEVFKFPELEKAEGRQEKRAGVTVTFDKTRKNDDIDEIILRIEYDEASNALESHRGWILKNGACLIDAAGGRVEYGSYRVINQTANSIQIAYLFALGRPLSDYQFVYETPSLIIRQPMQFTLKKIALP